MRGGEITEGASKGKKRCALEGMRNESVSKEKKRRKLAGKKNKQFTGVLKRVHGKNPQGTGQKKQRKEVKAGKGGSLAEVRALGHRW